MSSDDHHSHTDRQTDYTDQAEADAINAFERLGLTSYEAKVFIALHRLGTGTARDVASVTDVPRSQVYSVADALEERGLLEVQQASPRRFRPVDIEEARETLRARFEQEHDRAFSFVEAVSEDATNEETQEEIWTVRGSDRIASRIIDLCTRADNRLIFGARIPELVTDEIEATLEERATDCQVVVISRSEQVRKRLGALEGVTATEPPAHRADDDRSGRVLIADEATILLSVIDDAGEETAIWSGDSLFGSVLITLIEAGAEIPN